MTRSVGSLDALQLEQELQTLLQKPVRLVYYPTCASTNSECMSYTPDSEQHINVAIAEQQTCGRGRRGKTWYSPAGVNLYCSIGLSKKIDPQFVGLISLQVGISITEVLRKNGYSGISLKWPNDMLVEGKKLGGILIESRVIAEGWFYLVIGFGLNVNLHMGQMDEAAAREIDQPAISLMQLKGRLQDRQKLLSQIVPSIITAVQELNAHCIPFLLDKFAALDCLQGKEVIVKTLNQSHAGEYMGISQTGQVRVRTDDGIQYYSAAEISLREAVNVTD